MARWSRDGPIARVAARRCAVHRSIGDSNLKDWRQHMRLSFVSFLAAGLALMSVSGLAQQAPGLAARWEGAIQTPEKSVRIVVDLAKNSKGEWIGSFSIPAR